MRWSLILLCAAAIPAEAQQFVSIVPVVPSGPTSALPASEGYLHVNVTTQLAPLASTTDQLVPNGGPFGGPPKPELLAVTVRMNLGGREITEHPIAVYDIRNRTEVASVGLQLGRSQLVSFAGGMPQPELTFEVRAVPKELAAGFRSAIGVINNIAAAPMVASLVPAAAQVATASKMLTSFLSPSEAQNPGWKSQLQVGLGDGPLAVVPLDGSIAVLFLRPMRSRVSPPAYGEIEQCRANRTQVCLRGTATAYTQMPYILISASLSGFRDIQSLGAPTLSCASGETDVEAAAKAIGAGGLTYTQLQLEEALLERFRVVLEIQKGALNTDRAADIAYRMVHRDDGITSNPLWAANGAARAAAYERCVSNAIAARGLAETSRLNIYRKAFQTAATWQREVAPTTAFFENALADIGKPIAALQLRDGPAYLVLKEQKEEVERRLLPGDFALTAEAAAATGLAEVRRVRARLEARRTVTNCDGCRNVLTAALSQADARIAALERADAAAVAAAALEKANLAEARQSARQVAEVAAVVAPGPGADQLKQQAQAAAQVLSDPTVSAATVRALTSEIRQAVDSTQAEVRKPQP